MEKLTLYHKSTIIVATTSWSLIINDLRCCYYSVPWKRRIKKHVTTFFKFLKEMSELQRCSPILHMSSNFWTHVFCKHTTAVTLLDQLLKIDLPTQHWWVKRSFLFIKLAFCFATLLLKLYFTILCKRQTFIGEIPKQWKFSNFKHYCRLLLLLLQQICIKIKNILKTI